MVSRTFAALFIAALSFGQSLALPCHRPGMHRTTSSESSTAASPTSSADATTASTSSNNGNFGITPDQIRTVLPDTATCDSSASCRTADQAAPFINQSFQKFNFNTVGEQAAIFSLMAFESGHFKFDTNLGGTPGQGTRNMMMFNFILPYALEFNSDAVRAVRSDLTASSNDVSDDQKNAIRATVLGDDLSFASAAWFLREKCDGSVAQALQAANDDGFNNYMTQCIGVGADSARLAIYQATLAAMNQQN
jgi:hypothetical protein